MTKKSELDAIFQRAEEYYYGQNGQSHDTTKYPVAIYAYNEKLRKEEKKVQFWTCVASGLLRHFYK